MTTHLLARAVSIGVLGIALLDPGSARAQSTSGPSRSEPASQSNVTAAGVDDVAPVLAESDSWVLNLPSTLRLPLHGSNVQPAHRFNGNLRPGSVRGDASNPFELDQGAVEVLRGSLAAEEPVASLNQRADRLATPSGMAPSSAP